MKNPNLRRNTNILNLLVATAIAILFAQGCSFVQHSIAALKPMDHFIPSKIDKRVLYEPGAEKIADKIAPLLGPSIQRIEKKQYCGFSKPVRIYVCASRNSFRKYYGADVRAGVMLAKVYLSPRIFEHGDHIGKKYLVHELSHLHLEQILGIYKMSRLPMWFKEGLATYVSDGGGGNLVSGKDAIESIKAGKHLVPDNAGGFIFKKRPSDFNLKPHMFYRQSMMFLNYLAKTDESSFKSLLLSVQNGSYLPEALQSAYNKPLEDLWNEFIFKIKRNENDLNH